MKNTILKVVLNSATDAGRLWAILKTWRGQSESGEPLEVWVGIKQPGRTIDQNSMFHGICTQVAKSGFKWMGKVRSSYAWKVLFISGHAIATNEKAEVIPGLEGEFVNIRESSARMSKKRASSLIAYVDAWCAANEIELKHLEEE